MSEPWDFFSSHKVYGGWERVSPFILLVSCGERDVYVKSPEMVPVASTVRFTEGSYGAKAVQVCDELEGFPVCEGCVVRVFSKEDFSQLQMNLATKEEVQALGHFLCGAPFHGQWLGDLLEQVRQQAVLIEQLRNAFFAGV